MTRWYLDADFVGETLTQLVMVNDTGHEFCAVNSDYKDAMNVPTLPARGSMWMPLSKMRRQVRDMIGQQVPEFWVDETTPTWLAFVALMNDGVPQITPSDRPAGKAIPIPPAPSGYPAEWPQGAMPICLTLESRGLTATPPVQGAQARAKWFKSAVVIALSLPTLEKTHDQPARPNAKQPKLDQVRPVEPVAGDLPTDGKTVGPDEPAGANDAHANSGRPRGQRPVENRSPRTDQGKAGSVRKAKRTAGNG